MIEGFIRGLKARRPALFNLYASCQPEHGIGDDMASQQAKLVVESRGYPLFRYDPSLGKTPAECFDLDGNPAIDDAWPTYTLRYLEDGQEKSLDLPMTFADFAVLEARFRKQFRVAPPDTWNDSMVPLAEFLDLPPDEREGKFPFLWSVDRDRHLSRLLVAAPMVRSCEDRRDFWTMLRALTGLDRKEAPREEIEAAVRREMADRLVSNLVTLLGGQTPTAQAQAALLAAPAPAAPGAPTGAAPVGGASDYLAPWIDTPQCTSCDECIRINGKIFVYDADKKATIRNPEAGPYKDLVRAAEKCTARIIHPGLPRDRTGKDVAKWIERGAKFN
jgi:pyruvate-ferredoxin/flavodoxin oxidoreductase